MIHYQIQPVSPEAHLFRVVLSLPQPDPDGQVLRMPAWIPGSYMIRDFARHVVRFEARIEDQSVPWQKLDKDSWQLAPCDGPVDICIEVYAWDLSVRGAHLDTTHGYFNGSCVFLAPVGQEQAPMEVTILLPEGAAYATWRVATGMPRVSGGQWEFGRFRADDYDALIDYPVEMGHFDEVGFEACGVPHWLVLSGRHQSDLGRMARDLVPICEQHIRLFGDRAPMDSYLFMTQVTGDGYGGLEHRNSTSLMCARSDLARRTDGPGEIRDGYRNFLGLCSHEYFHSWNVKRIKPAAFTPYDLTRENYTELLWAFEGITSYYDDLAMVRSGVITVPAYLELLGQTLSRVARNSGTEKQTVTESSFDAWTRFYKQDENAPNAIVSYYAKGALIALCLDLELRSRSAGAVNLDQLMQQLWTRYGETGEGVPEKGIQALAESLLGASMDDFFQLALYSTGPLPVAELLARCGVHVHWRAPASHADNGGKPAPKSPVNLGARVQADPAGARLQVVFEEGAAMRAGLSAGDVIIAVDGLKVHAGNLEDVLAAREPGERVDIHAFRRDELMKFPVTLSAGPATLAWLAEDEGGLTEMGRQWLHVD